MLEIIKRSEAKSRGLTKFYNGKLCRSKHNSERWTASGACVECMRLKAAGRGDELVKPPVRPPEYVPPLLRPLATSTGPFEWTTESRTRLIDTYIDTGDLAAARDAVGLSASEYLREVERNKDFAETVAVAGSKARMHLKERARQLALKGNDKVLIAELKAEFPEYRDSLKIDQTQTVKVLSDSDLDAKIALYQKRLGITDATDAEFTEVRQIGTVAPASGEGTPGEPEQDIDPLLR